MEQSLFKKLIYLISFTVLLIAVVVKFDQVLALIYKGLHVLKPIILGGTIAFILNRPYKIILKLYEDRLSRKLSLKSYNALALTSTYLLFIGLIIALIAFVIPQFSESLQLLYSNMDTYMKNFQDIVEKLAVYLKFTNLDLSRFETALKELPSMLATGLTGVLPGVYLFTTNLIGSIVNIVIGLILSIYILSDKDTLKRQFLLLLETYMPKKSRKKLLHTLSIMNTTFGNFITGQLTEASILGALCFIGMLIFKFEYAFLISVLVGLTSLIPVVGAAIGLIPSIFILLLVNPTHALWFVIYIIVLMQIEGNLIYPRVVGGSIGLSPLWVLSTLIIGGGLFGILGMLIGIPMASVINQLIQADIKHRGKIKI